MGKTQEIHEIVITGDSSGLKATDREYKAHVESTKKLDMVRVESSKNAEKIKVESRKTALRMIQQDNDKFNKIDLQNNNLKNQKELADYKSAQAEKLRIKRQAEAELNRQMKTNAGLTGQSVELGSSVHIQNLKSMQGILNPTSEGYRKLAESIRQYEAELNKVNKSIGLSSWKNLNAAIKETKGELARLAAEQKTGTAEWQKYSDKLRELQRQKQLIQRETKLTSQQLLRMSSDLTIVAYGLRAIGSDIISLSQGKQSAGEMAMAIGGIGLQVLVVLPAIHGLTKALEAAGIVSASTITKLTVMASTLGTLAAGLASVTIAYGVMSGAVANATDIFGRLGDVISGQKSYWEAIKENIKDVTWGLLDFTEASNNFDSSNVQQQLSDIAYIANFSANALANLKQQVNDAITVNASKFLDYARKFNLPESYAGPEIPNSMRPGYYDDKGTWQEGTKKTTRSGTTKRSNKEKEAELDYLQKLRDKVKNLITEIQTLTSLETTADLKEYERLNILDEKIKKQKELNELTRENMVSLGMAANELTGAIIPVRSRAPYGTSPDINPRSREIEMSEARKRILEITESMNTSISNALSNLQNLPGIANSFIGPLVSGFQKSLGYMNNIFGFFKNIKDLLGAGESVGNIFGFLTGTVKAIGGLSGGGGGIASLNYNPPAGRNYASGNNIAKEVAVYISANMDGLTFFKKTEPKFQEHKKFKKA